MLKKRVIPCLLLNNSGLVKTFQFKNPKYVGDPINAVRIFNEKEVDEIVILDISATPNEKEPNYELIKDIASQAFMPIAYGGGITNINQIEKLFSLGVEKVVLNTIVNTKPELITEAVKIVGSSSVVVAIDVKPNYFGKYSVYNTSGKNDTKKDPIQVAKFIQDLGAGELILNSIDRDGMKNGYNLELIKKISNSIDIPLVALGGAGSLKHLKDAVANGASAVAAGSLFVFHGKHNAVLITYPEYSVLENLFD